MNIINQIITILTPLVPALLLLFNNKMAGLKVKLISILGFIVSGWSLISGTLLPQMCDQLHIFCNITSTGLFGTVGMIISFVTYVVRQLQGGAANLNELPARIMGKKK